MNKTYKGRFPLRNEVTMQHFQDHHKHLRKVKIHLYTVYVFTILLLILQIFVVYFFTIKIAALQHFIEEESLVLSKKIDGNYVDHLSNIRGLSAMVLSIESNQSNFQEQLGLLKASTSADFSDVAASSVKSVVTVATDVAQGSGFFIDDTHVVTNAHILANGKYVQVITYDQEVYSAELVGYHLGNDIALLKIKGSFEPLALGDSADVRAGEKVIAIGNPLGLAFTTTEGIVSAVDREGPNGLPIYIQTDVSLNPGNSGGPLINKEGEVIGINNFKLSNAESIGFALESNTIKETVNEIAVKALNETLLS